MDIYCESRHTFYCRWHTFNCWFSLCLFYYYLSHSPVPLFTSHAVAVCEFCIHSVIWIHIQFAFTEITHFVTISRYLDCWWRFFPCSTVDGSRIFPYSRVFLVLSSMMEHLKLKLHQLLFYKRSKTKKRWYTITNARNVPKWQTNKK